MGSKSTALITLTHNIKCVVFGVGVGVGVGGGARGMSFSNFGIRKEKEWMTYLKVRQAKVVNPPALPPLMHNIFGSTSPIFARCRAALLQSATSTIPVVQEHRHMPLAA